MINTLYLPELREMLADHDTAGLEEFCSTLHPARTAEYMEGLTAAESWEVLKAADVATRIELFGYFPREKQIEMIETLDRAEMAALIGDLPPDDRVDVLNDVAPEAVEELLPLVPTVERRDILRLQSYEEETAGRMMTTEFARLNENMTVRKVQEQFRKWGEQPELLEMVYYLYVVDDDYHLRGVVSFRELAFAALIFENYDARVGDLMQPNVVSVSVDQDQEEVAHVFADHDLLALPVVDQENRLVGIITHDDVIDVVLEEAAEDAQLIGGVQPLDDSYLESSILSLSWKRGIWLTILFIAAVFTAGALQVFERVTQVHQWLIMFIPLIISSGGNSGSQAATLIITGLNAEDVKLTDWLRVVSRECLMGLLLGGTLAILGLFVSLFMTQEAVKSIVVFLTLLGVVMSGTLVGSLLPLLFSRMGLDPALMSTPFVAGIMDILGIVIYMSVAQLLL